VSGSEPGAPFFASVLAPPFAMERSQRSEDFFLFLPEGKESADARGVFLDVACSDAHVVFSDVGCSFLFFWQRDFG
jgi:hypothetical protein